MKKQILRWAPRIIAILAVLFMMIFSLDCFGPGYSFKEQLICFVMHNIPAFIVIAALVIAWKWELVGGILFIAVFLAAGIFFHSFGRNPASLIVITPFLVVGVLFMLDYYLMKDKSEMESHGN
ncbi:MAG: hypothetical protein RBS55_02345 [Bacteroidales bacterium]|jgi:hypothetical protein|nr:hypothetical protein [Bacteroidales bacterium]